VDVDVRVTGESRGAVVEAQSLADSPRYNGVGKD
jgi:hypothetical protein